jgi:hypothetical protein
MLLLKKQEAFVKGLVNREKRYNFPRFLTELIRGLGLTTVFVASELNISIDRFHFFKSFATFRRPKESDLVKISDYFGVPMKLLVKKLDSYVGKPKKAKYRRVTAKRSYKSCENGGKKC